MHIRSTATYFGVTLNRGMNWAVFEPNETTTQDDIDHGMVNVVVGVALLKPAGFIIIFIGQFTGDASNGWWAGRSFERGH